MVPTENQLFSYSCSSYSCLFYMAISEVFRGYYESKSSLIGVGPISFYIYRIQASGVCLHSQIMLGPDPDGQSNQHASSIFL